jgi:hypothetical protein
MSQTASAQPLEQPLGLVRAGRGGEVEVVVRPAEHRVAHRAADQRELVTGRGEPLAELVDHRRDPVQLRRAAGPPTRTGRRRSTQITARGVYWIGVHVLGDERRPDETADGRARSFIPLVDGKQEAVPTSVILPVRRPVQRTSEGRISRADLWADDLDPGGRLSNLAAFVRSSGTTPVTWLIDPAVLDAADQLARGNPKRSLEPTEPAPGENDAEQQADEAGQQAAEADANGLPEAAAWLKDIQSLTARNPVLALPYGDLDVAAAARYAPGLYNQARSVSNEALDALGIESTPAVVPPSGLINPSGLGLTPFNTEIFLSEEALPDTYDDPADVPRSSSPAVAGSG